VDDWENVDRIIGWLKREKPDVIITPAANVLVGTLENAGWKIPQDIGLALLACPQQGDVYSGVYQNGKMIGALAVDTLISMVERHERGLPEQATTLMVEGQWNEGRTLRPVPARVDV
jgi:LacI family transcriptional regulator